ncbi:MAG: ABC transporter permease [Candidatus Krumholzibacteriota bacterium]|nr:ABC transporter permease [Candidatus Krumholzibacteriota bacterium]
MKDVESNIKRADEVTLRRSAASVWYENLKQAVDVLLSHKMRSGLLILGVAIGVTTVLTIVTVMSGLGKRVQQDILSVNKPYLIVSRFDPFSNSQDRRDLMRRKKLTSGDATAIAEECSTVDKVDLQVNSEGSMSVLRYGNERTNLIQILGASYNFGYMFNFTIGRGRFFSRFEQDHKTRVIVLGYGPAKDLFPNRDPIGKTIKIGANRYRVVGTMESRENIMGSISDNYAVIPYTVYEKDRSSRRDEYQIAVTMRSGYTLEEGMEEITALLRKRRGVNPGDRNNFHVTTSETFREMLGNITKYIGLILVVISSIGLMVGGIGVMNIMLISVTERTREVGIRMAMGANKKDILQQFLIEAATLTGLGGIIGIVMGLFAARGVATLIRFPYSVPFIWIVIAFIFSASIGLIFGLYPANKAARMDPIDALRVE